jgi:hypothetical protein
MAGMISVIQNALLRIGVVASGQTPNASDAKDTLHVANGLLAELAAKNIYTGASELGLQDEFPLEYKHQFGFESYLARNVAPLFQTTASPDVVRQSKVFEQLIAADYMASERLRVPIELQMMPSQRRRF